MSESGKSEGELIEWIRGVSRAKDAAVAIGIGDDMAMIRTGGNVLMTVDMLMDGVDFDTAAHAPESIGRKALAVGLSDCAAMAVRPRWALVSTALPNAWSMEQARRLHMGIKSLAERFDVQIIGGDTNSWNRPLVIDVIVLAEPWPGVQPVTRSGMRPGDVVSVTGKLGGSLAGHHLTFEPRVHEARQLAEALGDDLHATIDLSDGLSTDAHHLATASRCGIELDETALLSVASDAARATSGQDNAAALLNHVLNDGEDFELLFAYAGTRVATIEGMEVHRIGKAIEQPGVWLRRIDGSRVEIESRGWQHFRE